MQLLTERSQAWAQARNLLTVKQPHKPLHQWHATLDPPETAEVFLSMFIHTGRESDERGNGNTAESEQLAGPEEDEYSGNTEEEGESTQPTPAEPQPGTVSFLTLHMVMFPTVADWV